MNRELLQQVLARDILGNTLGAYLVGLVVFCATLLGLPILKAVLVFEVVYFVRSADYNTSMDVRQHINLRIKEEFERSGIAFAYPTQQIYLTKTP